MPQGLSFVGSTPLGAQGAGMPHLLSTGAAPPATTGGKRSMDSAIEAFTLRRLKVSDVAVKTATFPAPTASARSKPFSFGTSAE